VISRIDTPRSSIVAIAILARLAVAPNAHAQPPGTTSRGARVQRSWSHTARPVLYAADKIMEFARHPQHVPGVLMSAGLIATTRFINPRPESRYVPIEELRSLHPVDHPRTRRKTSERVQILKQNAGHLNAREGTISAASLQALLPSVTPVQAVRTSDGLFLLEGHGRIAALRRAFPGQRLRVEVSEYRQSNRFVRWLVRSIRAFYRMR
jgi:hypothetical protein